MPKITRPVEDLNIVIRHNDARIDRYLIDLLMDIDEHSSLALAARSLNSSYSFALHRISAVEKAMISPTGESLRIIERKKGSGSVLTPTGKALVDSYQGLYRKIAEPYEQLYREYFGE